MSLIWGSYSHLSGAWQTSGGVYISISIDDVPFYFNGKGVSNLIDPLEITLTYANQQIDYSFKHPYRCLVLYIDTNSYIEAYQNLLGIEYEHSQQPNLLSFYSQLEKNKLLELLIPATYGHHPNGGFSYDTCYQKNLAASILEQLILSLDYKKPNLLDRTSCQYLGLKAHALLLSQPNCQLSLSQIAKSLKAPLRSIQQGFSQLYGMSIIEYHQKFRLLSMREHIRKHGPKNIGQTAQLFGFQHAGRVSQMYKKTFGVLPSRDSLGESKSTLRYLGLKELPAVKQ